MAQQPKSFGRRGEEAGRPLPRSDSSASVPPHAGKIVALICAPIVILVGVGVYFAIDFLMASRDELDGFIEPMLVEMAAEHWNDETLKRYAGPELKRSLNERAVSGTMQALNKLGPILRYNGVYEFNVKKSNDGGEARAVVSVDFQSGTKVLILELERYNDRWRLLSLSLASQ